MKKVLFALFVLVMSSAAFSQTERKEGKHESVDQEVTFKPTGKSDNVYKPNIGSRIDNSSYTFTVKNEAGSVVYTTNDPNAGWDGTINGSIAPAGNYLWTVNYTETGSTKAQTAKGHLTVLK